MVKLKKSNIGELKGIFTNWENSMLRHAMEDKNYIKLKRGK